MGVKALDVLPILSFAAPFLFVVLILVYYSLRRAVWKRTKRRGGRKPGFCPSSVALGLALQFIQIFHRPSMAYVVEARLDDSAEDEDEGDPDLIHKQLRNQLRRIRLGLPVDTLVLRL